MIGFNFRASANYVTDGANQVAVDNVTNYPTVFNSVSFGWVGGAPTSGGRDRSASVDVRLAGVMQASNQTDSDTLFATNSGSGTFDITLALGDASFASGPHYFEIVEVNSSQVVQSVLATVLTGEANASGEFYDATGVNRTSAADWVTNNAPLQVTVSSGNSLGVRFGDPVALASGQTKIAHFAYEAATPSSSITSVDGDNTVVDGQQNVSVIVSGFAGDITSISLRVGTDTVALTGLTGTGDNYTINLPDITSFTSDTQGLPLSSATYQNEIVATNGTDTAAINITRNPKAGNAFVETVSAVATKGSIFENRTGGAPFDGSQIYYPTAGNTTISATGIIQTDATAFTAFVWDVTSKTWEVVTFNADSGGSSTYVKSIIRPIVKPIVKSILNN